MDYDNTQPPAIIRPYIRVAQEDCGNNDYGNLPRPEAPDMGGHAFFSNSSAPGTSINQQVTFIPREGPIPAVELDRVHSSRLMEIKPELRGTS